MQTVLAISVALLCVAVSVGLILWERRVRRAAKNAAAKAAEAADALVDKKQGDTKREASTRFARMSDHDLFEEEQRRLGKHPGLGGRGE